MRIVITTITTIIYHVSAANGFSIIQGFIFIAGMVRNMKQVLNEKLFACWTRADLTLLCLLYYLCLYIYKFTPLLTAWAIVEKWHARIHISRLLGWMDNSPNRHCPSSKCSSKDRYYRSSPNDWSRWVPCCMRKRFYYAINTRYTWRYLNQLS